MSCLDRLVENVRIVSTEANDFLSQPRVSTRRELHSAAIPQLVAMRHRIRHAAAGCFHRVFSHRLRLKWRQLAMPVHRSGTAVDRGAHTVILILCSCNRLIPSAQSRLDGLEIPDNGLDSRPNGLFAETVPPLESVAPHRHLEAAVRLEVAIATVDHPLNSLGNESPISRFRKLRQVGRTSPEGLRDGT